MVTRMKCVFGAAFFTPIVKKIDGVATATRNKNPTVSEKFASSGSETKIVFKLVGAQVHCASFMHDIDTPLYGKDKIQTDLV